MKLRAVLLTLVVLASSAPLAGALFPPIDHLPSAVPLGVPQDGDADVPASHAPDAVVTPFLDERWVGTEGTRTHTIVVPASPTGSWDRIIMVYREYPSHDAASQDPWDRLCSAGIAGVEVIRCTTPRTDFTLRRDVTEYSTLLPQGATVPIHANTGTYAGDGQWVTVKLEFYANEPTKLAVPGPHAHVVPAWYYRVIGASGGGTSAQVTFPAGTPTLASIDVTLSGHGPEGEFWYQNLNQPIFHLSVDGHELGQVWVEPYTYAFIGFYGGDYTLHPYMWWTAQQVEDMAGVHTGVGQIPAYRITVLPTDLALLGGGTHTVSLVGENGGGYWPSSVTFQLD